MLARAPARRTSTSSGRTGNPHALAPLGATRARGGGGCAGGARARARRAPLRGALHVGRDGGRQSGRQGAVVVEAGGRPAENRGRHDGDRASRRSRRRQVARPRVRRGRGRACRWIARGSSTSTRCAPRSSAHGDEIALVAMMGANNEVGSLQPVTEAAGIAAESRDSGSLGRRSGHRTRAVRLRRLRSCHGRGQRPQVRRSRRRRRPARAEGHRADPPRSRRRPGARESDRERSTPRGSGPTAVAAVEAVEASARRGGAPVGPSAGPDRRASARLSPTPCSRARSRGRAASPATCTSSFPAARPRR